MPHIDALIRALDDLLDPGSFDDYGPNGLQVPGRSEVRRIVTGVSAQRPLIQRAVELDAELVLVHHGLFWNFLPTGLSPVLAERLRPLFKHDVGLAAYHLPLDAHPEVGNNALLAEALGCAKHDAFAQIGRAARFAGDGVEATELFARVEAVTRRTPLVFDAGPRRVRRLAIVSGAAASRLPLAVAEGFDAFLTGEPSEHVMADARESGIHFIAAGHYATETFGVRRLGDWLAASFGVEHHWIDIPNPV
ncbi:MAG TPA: Nif3-like dinuclear metal center hexameric protein [Solirubrobacteraceae bacterium]|nr:Nif3-like dinuclear metal center hexameric protein [Solirubrobacteraceae bacterium]